MSRACAVCVLLACGTLRAADEVPPAPPPHPALPQLSLVLVENVVGPRGTVDTRRVVRVGVRNGKLHPAVTIWEGEQRFFGHFGGHHLVGARYLATKFGGVIDLRDKKVINEEDNCEFCGTEGTKVIYRKLNGDREHGVFSFDLATHKVQKEANLGEGKYTLVGVRSPDGTATIENAPSFGADELVLHQVGSKPKSLGKGFRIDIGPLSSTFGPTPVLWLNTGVVLTQRGNGKLVTVDVAGKVTDLLTIKDAPKDLVSAPYLFRDGSNRIIYVCGPTQYTIDVEKKTATVSEWRDVGHGFEIAWERHEKFGHKLRHNGKEFGSINCWPYTARTAPGLLAVEARYDQEPFGQPECVAVWSVDVGEWQTVKLWPNSIVGWIK
jgi:hypothetical protein